MADMSVRSHIEGFFCNHRIVITNMRLLFFFTLLLLCCFPVGSAELNSYALIREDGSLLIRGKIVHLNGIYILPTERQCQTLIRPVRCAIRQVSPSASTSSHSTTQ